MTTRQMKIPGSTELGGEQKFAAHLPIIGITDGSCRSRQSPIPTAFMLERLTGQPDFRTHSEAATAPEGETKRPSSDQT